MMLHARQAVILAGGQGARLRPFTEEHPKPLYPAGGRPFLEHLLLQVRAWGLDEVLILLGYKSDQVVSYIKAHPVPGLNVSFDIAPLEFETAGRLWNAHARLHDIFLLMYCDNYCPIDYSRHEAAFSDCGALVQLAAYANHDSYTKDNLLADVSGKVLLYDKSRRAAGLSGVDIGYALVRKEALALLPSDCSTVNFESFVYPLLVERGQLFATFTEHRYYSVGGWDRMPLTERFFSTPPTLFLDRDGTLNVRPPVACYVERPEDFVWLPGAREAVAELKRRGWRIILVTNQPGIARGVMTVEALDAIHAKMQAELRAAGAEIDAIYYCPHGWDEGCECRKPKPGLLYRAQKDFCLDLTRCVLIGDDERDIQAANAANCRSILVNQGQGLAAAVDQLLGED